MSERAGPAGVLIRPLRSSEAASYREIRLEGLRLHPDAFTSSYEEEAALTEADFAARIPGTPPDVILGAFVGDAGGPSAIVGVVGFHAGTRLKQRHRADVWGMYVRHAARGRGIAGALLGRIVQHARGIAGIEQVHLTVEAGNPAARAVYQAAGFLAYGIDRRAVKLGPGEYRDAEMRVLDLTGGR